MIRLTLVTAVIALTLSVIGCGGQTNRQESDTSQTSETLDFAIEGMDCEGCVSTVTTALKSMPGVQSVEVSLEAKKATVVADRSQLKPKAIEDAVGKAGYKAQLITAKEQPLAK